MQVGYSVDYSISMDESDAAGRVVFCSDGTSFSDLVRSKMAPESRIQLHGCQTARVWPWESVESKRNIAQQLSKELPGVAIEGYRGFAFGNELSLAVFGYPDINFRPETNSKSLGITRTYITLQRGENALKLGGNTLKLGEQQNKKGLK